MPSNLLPSSRDLELNWDNGKTNASRSVPAFLSAQSGTPRKLAETFALPRRRVLDLLQTECGLADGLALTVTWGALGSARVPRAASGVAPDSRSTTISPAERESGERGLRRDAEAGTRDACAPRKLPPLTDEPGEQPTLSPDEPFASWLGLGPDNRLSGGRILKAGTRKVANRIATLLRLAANSLGRAQGRMGDFVRRFKGRLGKAEGIVAGAHKLARIIWAMVVSGRPYDEAKAFDSTPAATARRLKNLNYQAHSLNMKRVPR